MEFLSVLVAELVGRLSMGSMSIRLCKEPQILFIRCLSYSLENFAELLRFLCFFAANS